MQLLIFDKQKKELKMKYEIEIEGLPEGWKPVAYRHANHESIFECGKVVKCTKSKYPCLIVEKIKTRRIVLEETEEVNKKIEKQDIYNTQYLANKLSLFNQPKIWREVTENEEQK